MMDTAAGYATSGRDKRSIISHHRVPGKSVLNLMLSLCPSCHAKVHRTKAVLSSCRLCSWLSGESSTRQGTRRCSLKSIPNGRGPSLSHFSKRAGGPRPFTELRGAHVAYWTMSQRHVEAHVDLIAKHEQEFLAKRTPGERLGDRVASWVGSLIFVSMHFCFFVLWILWNSLLSTRRFDPYPFSLLGTVVAMEGIILASFILMRQSRMARRADERDHLMLQILLLTEKEITAVLKVDRQIAAQVGAEGAANTAEVRELSKPTSIEEVAQTIRENLDAVEAAE